MQKLVGTIQGRCKKLPRPFSFPPVCQSGFLQSNYSTYGTFANRTDTAPTAVASGTAPNSAVFGFSAAGQGPADVTLVGGLSQYGIMGLNGNVWEWQETEFDLTNDVVGGIRYTRGSAWNDGAIFMESNQYLATLPNLESNNRGFRVAIRFSGVPEPGSMVVVALAGIAMLVRRRKS